MHYLWLMGFKVGEASMSYEYEGEPIYCLRWIRALLIILTSDDNSGRRFFGNRNYQV